jgi:tetratricopeptide (TPR) repeat protein
MFDTFKLAAATAMLSGALVCCVVAKGQDTVRIGGVEVPADCSLARKEHPRLLFTKADLPRLRQRLKNPRIAAELARGKQLAAENKAGAILLGVLYYLTEQREYIEQAKAKLLPAFDQTYALAADLVMGVSSPAGQQAEADRIVQVLRKNRWGTHVVLDLAAWGHGHDEFLDAELKTRYRTDMVQGIEYNNLWSQGRGGSSMSHHYNGEHFYSERFMTAVAWSNATGQDWVSKCDFAAHTPEYYLFHYRPWLWPPQVVHIGVNMTCSSWDDVIPAMSEGDNLAVLAAARFHDGLGQWWVDQVISKISMGWGTSALGQGGIWGKLLWYDPELPPVEPKMLPPARLFPENGHVVMRSDWTADATYALFRCGRYGEIDGYWGRNHADNLHFIINKRGILAADTGAAHAVNNWVLGFAGAGTPSGIMPHMTEYARQTIAHNSILVGGDLPSFYDSEKRWHGTVRSGGQSPIQDKTWWKLWGMPEPKPGDRPFRQGQIIAYETSPLFDYAAGDATHSYPPTRVKRITRQFVYLRPDTFVVFDRVANAEANLETKWLLHSLYEPRFNGRQTPDLSLSREKQLAIAPDGKSMIPNPQPGGRFLHTGGDTFVINDKLLGMTGRLFVKILLPAKDARVLRTIGGPWHEFEVDGINYGPTADTYSNAKKSERLSHNRVNSIGLSGWRIELFPKDTPAETNFLVVLQAANQATPTMVPVELVERSGQIGAKATVGTTVYEVTFATTGPVAGQIRISRGDKLVLNRDLSAGVEDNYKKWSDHPNYKIWMTRREYKNFIGVSEVEAYRFDTFAAEIEKSVVELGYPKDVAQDLVRLVRDWKCEIWQQTLSQARQKYQQRQISPADAARVEQEVIQGLSQTIRSKIAPCREEEYRKYFYLSKVVKDKKAQCLGYAQLVYILGNSLGLRVTAIGVMELASGDLPSGESLIACCVELTDGRVTMVDLTQNLVSKPFVFLEMYRAAGKYWELKQKDNPLGIHRQIQICDKSGLCGTIYNSLGNAYDEAGDHAQAISCSTKAIELNPSFAAAYCNRGTAYNKSGQLANSLSDYTKAIELNPKYANAYFNRGVVNALMGKTVEAEKDLQKAVELNPALRERLKKVSDRFKLGL